jgi:ParB-like nuclease domain
VDIKIWPLSRIVEYARNPRNNDAAVDRMCASMREFGFKIPCLVRSDGELIDGHLRLKAARSLGLKEIPVILCDEWTAAQVKAFRLLVNRSATWADFDEELLGLELQDIQGMDFDLSLTGFDVGEIDGLLATPPSGRGSARDDEGPDLSQAEACATSRAKACATISRLGDLWLCGPHRVLCGDATNEGAVARLLGERQVRLLVTDIRGGTRADWSRAFELVPGVEAAYVWHDSKFTREVLDGLLRIGFEQHEQIIWDKGEGTAPYGRGSAKRMHYRVQHEPCWYVRRENAPWFGKAGENSTVWASEDKMRKPILNHLRRGELVYDPFLGNGTPLSRTTHSLCASTLAAAESTQRVCCGMEADPERVDAIVQRWQVLTGRQATKEAIDAAA